MKKKMKKVDEIKKRTENNTLGQARNYFYTIEYAYNFRKLRIFLLFWLYFGAFMKKSLNFKKGS